MTKEVNTKMKLKKTIVALFSILLMVLAVAPVNAEVTLKQVSNSYFTNQDYQLINFEDATTPSTQYWNQYGVKFLDTDKTKTIVLTGYNRGYQDTASGDVSIFSDGKFPATSANVPLTIEFKEGMKAVGFYAGNGLNNGQQVKATVTAYNQNGQVLGSILFSNIKDPVTTFIGLEAPQQPIYKVSLDYGDSLAGEEIDDVMFIKAETSTTTTEPITETEPVTGNPVIFSVGVNDYPDHQDYSLSKNLPNAYVNMYTVKLANNGFKVIDYKTVKTSNDVNPSANLTVEPGQMVYFEGFKTLTGAQNGAEEKQTFLWTAPPYKNFGQGRVCQTNWMEVDKYLQGSESSACADSLSVPYQDKTSTSGTAIETKVDLTAANLEYDQTSFKAKVCNLGNKDVSGVKVRFTANGKTNDLTYAPSIPANGCTTLYSWGFSYFGMTVNDKVEATLYVDPMNVVSETNENNNKLILQVSNGQVVTEQAMSAKYFVFPRSQDKTARGIVGKYLLSNGVWSLVDTTYATLEDTIIVSPNGQAPGQSYYAEMSVNDGETVAFVAFYPISQIPDKINNNNFPSEVPLKFNGKNVNGKVQVCDLTEGCSKTYGSHSQELLYFNGQEFQTIYSNPELGNKDLFVVGEQTQPVILPAYNENKWPVNTDNTGMQKPSKEDCASGCSYNGKCLPVGTKLMPEGRGSGVYCSWDGQTVDQKYVGEFCQNDYECTTNSCMNGKCLDLEQQFRQQQNLLERILSWLGLN
ncbi:hypothetical protein COY27_06280 [Candidatus Woesearchaeota archaeon CG_4_10_14_0_2_um_filter_33_13]|nr:MAG: hypothetical protein COY27_06280 [Candidatus Woesearchaeota archaeon CG_4_10_14_0_2_um_filter_33_13]